MSVSKRALIWISIILLSSCEITDYDFGPIHNHPPYLEFYNEYEDGILRVKGHIESYPEPYNYERYAGEILYGDELRLPVEPGQFKVYFFDIDSVAKLDTLILNIRHKDKHNKIVIPWD